MNKFMLNAEEEFKLIKQVLERSSVLAYRVKIENKAWILDYISHNTEQLGYAAEEIMALGLWAMIHSDDQKRVAAEMEKYCVSGGADIKQEYRVVAKNGQIHWFSDLTEIIRNERGEAQYFQGTLIDITEHREMEEKLQEASMILKNSAVVLYRVKPYGDWPIQFISDNIRQFGYEPKDLIGHNLQTRNIMFSEDFDRTAVEMEEYFKTRPTKPLRQEYRIYTKDRQERSVEDFSEIVYGPGNQPEYYRGMILDVTERRKTEEKLKGRTAELEKLNNYMVGREVKMTELKKEIERLKEKCGEKDD